MFTCLLPPSKDDISAAGEKNKKLAMANFQVLTMAAVVQLGGWRDDMIVLKPASVGAFNNISFLRFLPPSPPIFLGGGSVFPFLGGGECLESTRMTWLSEILDNLSVHLPVLRQAKPSHASSIEKQNDSPIAIIS